MKKIKNLLFMIDFYQKVVMSSADRNDGRLYFLIYLTGIGVCYIFWNIFLSVVGNINYEVVMTLMVVLIPGMNLLFNFVHMPYWIQEGYKEMKLYAFPISPQYFFYIKFGKDILLKIVLLLAVILPLMLMKIDLLELINILLLGIGLIFMIDILCAIALILAIRYLNVIFFRFITAVLPVGYIFLYDTISTWSRRLVIDRNILYLIDLLILLVLSRLVIQHYKYSILKNYEKQLFKKRSMRYLFYKVPYFSLAVIDVIRDFSYYAMLISRILLVEVFLYYNVETIKLLGKTDAAILVSFIVMINAFNYYSVTCISKDRTFKKMLSLPISMKRALDTKIIISIVISLALIVALYSFSSFTLRWNYRIFLFAIVYTTLIAYIGVYLDYHNPNFDYDNIDQLIRKSKSRINLLVISLCFYFIFLMVSEFQVDLNIATILMLMAIFWIRRYVKL